MNPELSLWVRMPAVYSITLGWEQWRLHPIFKLFVWHNKENRDNAITLYVSCLLSHNNNNKMPTVYSITLGWEQWRLYSKNRDNAITFAFLSFKSHQKKHVYCNVKLMESLNLYCHMYCVPCTVYWERLLSKEVTDYSPLWKSMKIFMSSMELLILPHWVPGAGASAIFAKLSPSTS